MSIPNQIPEGPPSLVQLLLRRLAEVGGWEYRGQLEFDDETIDQAAYDGFVLRAVRVVDTAHARLVLLSPQGRDYLRVLDTQVIA
jgi:hypothetical protein